MSCKKALKMVLYPIEKALPIGGCPEFKFWLRLTAILHQKDGGYSYVGTSSCGCVIFDVINIMSIIKKRLFIF